MFAGIRQDELVFVCHNMYQMRVDRSRVHSDQFSFTCNGYSKCITPTHVVSRRKFQPSKSDLDSSDFRQGERGERIVG